MLRKIGSGIIGSSSLQTSSANEEIVPSAPSNWNYSSDFYFYRFSFMNRQDCTVKINGSNPIFIEANQGINLSQIDIDIWSFIVVESDIDFSWIGGY